MKRDQLASRFASFAAVGVIFFGGLLGCTSKDSAQKSGGIDSKNLVKAGNPNTVQTIGGYTVLGANALRTRIASGEVSTSSEVETTDKSLYFGLPLSSLNQPMIFGSVITKVSDKTSTDLGNLKLADLPAFQVLLVLHKTPDATPKYFVSLMNCSEDCSKTEDQSSLIDVPVVGSDASKKLVYLDLSALGSGLDLTAIRKGDPDLEKFKSKSSLTVLFDYSQSTLVFDVEAHLIDKDADATAANLPETVITNRWYLRSLDGLNPQFVKREATPGVGYFMTTRSDKPQIQRWDFDKRGSDEGIKYYIKHVPAEYQAAFAGAFDEWNTQLLPIVGKKVFSYEFIPEGDARNELLVAGDIRYNVMEWDLVNMASYGGLGPSVAHPFTGEVFQANVLIQGPTIVGLYTKWFQTSRLADGLRAEGNTGEAERLLAKTQKELRSSLSHLSARTFEIHFGKQLTMKVRSQDPALEDPLMSKDGFDEVPAGFSYETYMPGYFHDMVAHELGHNLGLRHNFKGNLGASEGKPVFGKVSRSVMEYLGRGYRYLDHIGPYDLMAISYGYAGKAPDHLNWFCTDEDKADLTDASKTAECTSDDATDDPFDFFKARFAHAADLAVSRGKTSAPDWSLDDLKPQLDLTLKGLGAYAKSAEETGSTWTNFFHIGDHPDQVTEVRGYVLTQLKSVLCDPSISAEIAKKGSSEDQSKTKANFVAFQEEVNKVLKPVFSDAELACATMVAAQ